MGNGGAFEVDDTETPLLRIVYPARVSRRAIDAYVEALLEVGERGGPIWTLVDLRHLDLRGVEAPTRHYLAERLDEAQDRYPAVVQGEACISASLVVRMLYRTHLWVRRPQPYPSRIFATEKAAREWLRECIARGPRDDGPFAHPG